MKFTIIEPRDFEIHIIRHGNTTKALYFFLMGSLFQVLFIWSYWSFLDSTGPLAYLWLTIINMDLFPFTTILFIFGAGCLLISLKEFRWIETIVVQKNLESNEAGLIKGWKFLFWNQITMILASQIISLRILTIPQDKLKFNCIQKLEIDYIMYSNDQEGSHLDTILVYSDECSPNSSQLLYLAKKIQKLLDINEIEHEEIPV